MSIFGTKLERRFEEGLSEEIFAGIADTERTTLDGKKTPTYTVYYEGKQPTVHTYFEDGRNYALNDLMEQLGIEELTPATLKKAVGKTIKVWSTYNEDQTFLNQRYSEPRQAPAAILVG